MGIMKTNDVIEMAINMKEMHGESALGLVLFCDDEYNRITYFFYKILEKILLDNFDISDYVLEEIPYVDKECAIFYFFSKKYDCEIAFEVCNSGEVIPSKEVDHELMPKTTCQEAYWQCYY